MALRCSAIRNLSSFGSEWLQLSRGARPCSSVAFPISVQQRRLYSFG
jgi:hypothetical protein